jgi:hypothetical protein
MDATPLIPGICKEEDANNGLMPPRKIIVIIMLPTTHNNLAEAVEDKDRHLFFFLCNSIIFSYLIVSTSYLHFHIFFVLDVTT